jgi:hypothetical protein
MTAKATTVLAAALILLAAAGVQATPKKVSFRNTKDGSLKLYCQKIGGKIKISILCNEQPFTPDADWEEIKAEKVCFQHDDGRIRACHELRRIGGNGKTIYVCFDNAGKPFSFLPGNDWKLLTDSDNVCGKELVHSDVIRYTDMPPLDIDL